MGTELPGSCPAATSAQGYGGQAIVLGGKACWFSWRSGHDRNAVVVWQY